MDRENGKNDEMLTEINKERMTCVALLYLWTPIVLFILTWMKIHIAVPTTLAGLCALYFGWNECKHKVFAMEIPDRFGQWAGCGILCFCLLSILCVVSGIGGYAPQGADWFKHNTILHDLVEMSWPVWYNFNGEQGVLVYYIGAYLVPAGIGKLTNFNVAVSLLLWWSVIGLFLACVCFYLLCGKRKPGNLLLITIGIFFFSSFYAQCRDFFPDYFRGYYGAHLQSLQQVTPQFVATLLTVALWLLHRHNYTIWGILVLPLMLYSTFAFLGLVILATFVVATEYFSGKFEKLDIKRTFFSISNIFALLPFLVILLYICSNVLQQKPDSSGMGFKILSYDDFTIFISYTLSWILWFVVLYRAEHKNVVFWAAAISLLMFPLFQMGKFNDLCNKGSMPAFAIICFLVIKNIITSFEKKKLYCFLLIFCLYISGSEPLDDLHESASQHLDLRSPNHRIAKTDEDFYFSSDWRKYQYIAWDLGGLLAHKVNNEGRKEFYFNTNDVETMMAVNKSYAVNKTHDLFALHRFLLRPPSPSSR